MRERVVLISFMFLYFLIIISVLSTGGPTTELLCPSKCFIIMSIVVIKSQICVKIFLLLYYYIYYYYICVKR